MPTLKIDDRTVTVDEGGSVLEAAKVLGIVIPHFCYHEALGAVGACRLCAMSFLEGPVKGVQMSCMVQAKDGMVVSTLDSRAVELRKSVIEWMMINHPHDCPVCDEGGQCQLQDMTIAGGHSMRRYRGPKRTWNNQDLGPFIEQEMNRCIQCYRCVRTYQDYCGGTDFGVMGSRQRLFFGRFRDGALQSPFSGNLADVCPTGVFTDKTFRFKARLWDLEEAPSVCPHCSLGCATVPGARYHELLRTVAGINPHTNGFFICDRGRFGGAYVNHPERPREPRWKGKAVGWPEAMESLQRQLSDIVARHGGEALAFVGSSRASLESLWMLRRVAKSYPGARIAFDSHAGRDRVARRVASLSPSLLASLEDVRCSDFALLLGSDPSGEAPMLALALRQSVRAGGEVFIADPRPLELPFEAKRLSLLPQALPELIEALETGQIDGLEPGAADFVRQARQHLAGAKRPLIVGGMDLLTEQGVLRLERLATRLRSAGQNCRMFIPLGGPGSFAGALMSAEEDFDDLLDGIHQGKIRALVCLEADPYLETPDPGRVQAALEKLDSLVVLDYLPGVAARNADLLLPTRGAAETGGTFVNNEGRMLPFAPVFSPGLPLRVTGEGDHPPRRFEAVVSGSAPRAAWEILGELAGETMSLRELRLQIAGQDPRLAPLARIDDCPQGVRASGGSTPLPLRLPEAPSCIPAGALQLLPVELALGTELLASFSSQQEGARPEPEAWIHPDEGAAMLLVEGERCRVTTALGHLELPVRFAPDMARKILVLPRLRDTALGDFVPGGGDLWCRIQRGSHD